MVFLLHILQSVLLKIKLHLFYLFLLGLLLIISAAGPYREGLVEDVSGKGKIILVLDGSFSMLAGDTSPHPVTSKYPQDRFAEAQTFCEELIDGTVGGVCNYFWCLEQGDGLLRRCTKNRSRARGGSCGR